MINHKLNYKHHFLEINVFYFNKTISNRKQKTMKLKEKKVVLKEAMKRIK